MLGKLCFPRVGSFESTGGFFAYSTLFSSLQGRGGIGVSSLNIGISQLKVMCQHTDRKRREKCVDNEMLQRNHSHMLAVVS